ncbi:hypothetical protein OBV_14810 [Oscillibacter valericigenes Sjm18-20]|nr:hypothetical protein OBV_14810 [Oscillibacter valericigenes Sjm18-20]
MCTYDYDMAEQGGTVFTRQYTLASGGTYCDCRGFKNSSAVTRDDIYCPNGAKPRPL